MSNNFLVSHVAANQNQKEVTINQAIDEIVAAISNLISIAVTGTVTLTTTEGGQAYGNLVYQFTGTLGSAQNVIVPATPKLYIVQNLTGGGFKLTIKTPSGTGVDFTNDGNYHLVLCDGTNVVSLGGAGSAIGGVSAKTADYTIVSGDNGTLVVLTSGSHTFTPPAPATTVFVFIENTSSGTLTLSHNSKNINGAAADVSLAQGAGGILFSDGTNYFFLQGAGGGGALSSLSDVTISSPADGQVVMYDGGSSKWKNKSVRHAIVFEIDGAGSTPGTGTYGQVSVPFACTIVGWNLTADASSSAVVDVLRSTGGGFPSTSSIAGTDKPTLSSAQRAHDTTLTGWGSTALAQFDELQVALSSVSGSGTRFVLTIYVDTP